MPDTILVSRDAGGHVARVVLNRPEKLNCVSTAMWSELAAIFRALDAVLVLVLVLVVQYRTHCLASLGPLACPASTAAA